METESLCLLPAQMPGPMSCNTANKRGEACVCCVMIQLDHKSKQSYRMNESSLTQCKHCMEIVVNKE